MLADQAVLAGARDVPPGVAMPLTADEYRRSISEYEHTELGVYVTSKPPEKPIEELVPPDFLWLLARTPRGSGPFSGNDQGLDQA
ncbi:MAG: hypothetical protein LBP33_03280 [Candidatus Adiutrix sp.]|nr:hypothetical protein [Candidatus Adiutrix sp.]